MANDCRLRASRIIDEVHPEFSLLRDYAHSDFDGKWYELPAWPAGLGAVLLDDDGYVHFSGWFEFEKTLARHGIVRNTVHLNIPNGISSWGCYKRCTHSHWDEVYGNS